MRMRSAVFAIALAAAVSGCSTGSARPDHSAGPAPAGSIGSAAPVTPTQPTASDNGIALRSPHDILLGAAAALTARPGFRYGGQSTASGQFERVDFTSSGNDKKVSLTAGSRVIDLLVLAGQSYLRVPDSLLQVPPGCACTIEELSGKFVLTASKNPNVVGILGGMPPTVFLAAVDSLTTGKVTTVNGQAVVQVIATRDGKVAWTLSVATEGDPVPLRMTSRSGDNYDFDYDPVTIAVPPQSELFVPFILG